VWSDERSRWASAWNWSTIIELKMSLTGTLNVARSALTANQIALQTVGNNIANAGNADYTRQVTRLKATAPQEIRHGLFVGTGVNVDSIERMIDESVEQRLRAAVSDGEGASAASQWLSRVESVFNELSDEDLSTAMSKFFNSWSELANKPQDVGLRQVVLQDGQNLATRVQSMRKQFDNLSADVAGRLTDYVGQADELAQKIADLNAKIAVNEAGGGGANTLRDQRDSLLRELSKSINISTDADSNGMVNVYVGSEPLVMGGTNRGVTSIQELTEDGDVVTSIIFEDNEGRIPLTSGLLGGTAGVKATIDGVVGNIDALAGGLIFELNKVHASGQGLVGVSTVTSEHAVADDAAALNSESADLDFAARNGSFVVHVRDKATGTTTSTLIQVDLDGQGTDTSLADLQAQLNGVDDVTASINAGRLTISAEGNAVELTFSQDSSGVLSALGIGGFFSGTDGRDIAVNQALIADPRKLAAAKNGQTGDNQTARAIADLQNTALDSLGGQTLKDRYQSAVNAVAARVAGAREDADAAGAVRDTLQAQRDALSGVSLDEEAIELLKYQRAYQGAARVVSITDELMQTILNMV
jgi:flagellar hook-associated protein 1